MCSPCSQFGTLKVTPEKAGHVAYLVHNSARVVGKAKILQLYLQMKTKFQGCKFSDFFISTPFFC